jgi:transcriptional regulator with XRE-family HTH domain
MAPLDTGYVTHTLRLVDTYGQKVGPSPEDYATLGAYLRAIREHRGLSVNELALSTRIRRSYLTALEDSDRSALPSRPFAIGYMRSYAKALGLDGELAVVRFKADWPEDAGPLRNPIGVEHDETESDGRKPVIWAAVTVVVVGLGVWNIAQRALVSDPLVPAGLDAAVAAQPLTLPVGPVKLSAPEPPPQDSTLPVPYITPGMAEATAARTGAAVAPPPVTVSSMVERPDSATFQAKGTVFGAPAGVVILQAKKPASLVVRGPDKTVYFARQLAAGEAFRAPSGRALVAEVTNPAAFLLYVGGDLKGSLVSPLTPIDRLAASAPAPAAPPPT